MKKLGVINVATSCLDYCEEKFDLITLYNPIEINGKTYKDFIDIKAEEFYEMIDKDHSLVPRTAMPSFKDLDEAINKHIENKMTEIIVITISSGLSATWEHLKNFVEQNDYPARVHVFDSKAASIHEGYLDMVSCEYAEKGLGLDELIPKLEYLRDNSKVYFTVGELRLLAANGRIGKAQSLLGSAIQLKPILSLDKSGQVEPIKKVRTSKKANEEMVKIVFDQVEGKDIECFTFITTNYPEMEEFVYNLVKEKYPNVKIHQTYNTPGIGCHIGGHLVGLGYYLK